MDEFQKELERLINRFRLENESSTPDFLLAEYLVQCLKNYNQIIRRRDEWWGIRFDNKMGITLDVPTPIEKN